MLAHRRHRRRRVGAGHQQFQLSYSTQNNSDLASVQFYQGTTLLGSGVLQGQSYDFAWNSVPARPLCPDRRRLRRPRQHRHSAPVNITVYAPGLQPTNYVWTGAVSTDWFNPANWSPNGVPRALDNVSIATARRCPEPQTPS